MTVFGGEKENVFILVIAGADLESLESLGVCRVCGICFPAHVAQRTVTGLVARCPWFVVNVGVCDRSIGYELDINYMNVLY
jgi:hypothetical protein